MKNLIKKILSEEFQNVEDYKRKYSNAYENYPNQKILPVILKYLDGMVTIDMIVKSNDNPTTYCLFDDVKKCKNYVMG